MTPDPSSIDGLLVRKSGLDGGVLPDVGRAAEGGVPPDLNSENFDESFLIDNNNNETHDS